MTVRLRFACDPKRAGQLDMVRLAILNWLFCRRQGGAFTVRVNCDEPVAVVPDSLRQMFRSLEWLGLESSEKPVFQSQGGHRYLAAAETLLAAGVAFQDPMAHGAVAFRATQHNTTLSDLVRGPVDRNDYAARDLLIIRADGTATPAFAEVVDDLESSITHVIRDESALPQTFVQVDIFRALGGPLPLYAHVPPLLDVTGQALNSVDQGGGSVEALRQNGYLAAAVLTYLATIGFRTTDVNEAISRQDLVDGFDLARLVQSPPKLDPGRLEWLNGEYVRTLSVDEFARGIRPLLAELGVIMPPVSTGYVGDVITLIRGCGRTFADLAAVAAPFFTDDYEYEPNAVKLHLQNAPNHNALRDVITRLASLSDFTAMHIDGALKQAALTCKLRPSMLAYAVRVASTGRTMGPELGPTLALLGRERLLARLGRAVEQYPPV